MEININQNNYTIKSPKKKRYAVYYVLFAIAFIATAVFIVLDKIGLGLVLFEGISLWQLCLGLFLLVFIIVSIIEKKLPLIPFLLGILFLIFQKNIFMACGKIEAEATPFSFWLVMLICVLLSLGTWMIFRRGKATVVTIDTNGKEKEKDNYDSINIKCENNGKESILYVDPSISPSPYRLENNLGTVTLYLENTENYEGDYTIQLENNLGSVEIFVPEHWSIDTRLQNSIGKVYTPRNTDTAKTNRLYIYGENNLGKINIQYR